MRSRGSGSRSGTRSKVVVGSGGALVALSAFMACSSGTLKTVAVDAGAKHDASAPLCAACVTSASYSWNSSTLNASKSSPRQRG